MRLAKTNRIDADRLTFGCFCSFSYNCKAERERIRSCRVMRKSLMSLQDR